MSDPIERQAAIDALDEQIRQCDKALSAFDISMKDEYAVKVERASLVAFRETLEYMPSAQPGWIPVTERLPEDAYPVIVTWKNDDPKSYYQYILGKHYTGVAHFKNGIWYWYSSTTEDVLMEYGRCDSEEFDEAIQVLAWQPLPTPYRERGQDGED